MRVQGAVFLSKVVAEPLPEYLWLGGGPGPAGEGKRTRKLAPVFQALAKVHRTQDMASRLWLEEKFATFEYTALDMSSHVLELKRLMLDMNGGSCGPSEEDTCATLLRSLSVQYESLVQSFRMSVTQFSFKGLVSKVNAE